MTATGIYGFGLALVIPLVLACLVIAGRVSADAEAPTSDPPARPTGLQVTAHRGSLDVSLDWDDVDGVSDYLVRWRSVDSGEKLNEGVEVQASSTAITLADYGEWVVRVQACNDAGCGKPANKAFRVEPAPDPAPEQTPEPTPEPEPEDSVPSRPSGLAVSAEPGSLDVSVNWDDSDGATSYLVRWRAAGPGNPLNDGKTVASSSAIIAVDDFGEWVVRVEACNDAGCGLGAARRFGVEPPPNRAPVVNREAENYENFTGSQNTPRGILVRKFFDGLFSDPDGDELTYTASVSTGRDELVSALQVKVDSRVLFFEADAEGDWSAVSPALPNPVSTEVTLTATDPDGLSASVTGLFNTQWEPSVQPSVCDRTSQVRDKLVQVTDRSCGSITAEDLAGITALDFTNSDITSLQNGDFNGLSNLENLNLSYNDLTALPEDVFDGLSNLERLDFFDNMIESLPEDVFDGLSSLDYLDLNCGRMTTLPEDVFDGLSNLEWLILDEGYLTTLPEGVFDGLSSLEFLRISDNRLTALPQDLFDGLSNLEELDLGYNDLAALPEGVFDGLSSLWSLKLYENDVTTLPEDVFADLSSLYNLDMRDNELTGLPESVFDNMSSLELLDLRDNELSTLSEETFDDLPKMWNLGLSGNPGYPFDLNLPDFVWTY